MFIVFLDELGFFNNGKDVISLDLLSKPENSRYEILCWLSKEALDFQLRTLQKTTPRKSCSQNLMQNAVFFGCDSLRCNC